MPTLEAVKYSVYPCHIKELGQDVRLVPTRHQVYSITSTIELAKDGGGGLFFMKPILSSDKEIPQLLYLDEVGIPVPNPVLINKDRTLMATPFSGSMLSSMVATLEREEAAQLLFRTGALLQQVHRLLRDNPPPDDIVAASYDPTAHIVDCFYYRHIGVINQEQYARYKLSLSTDGSSSPRESKPTLTEIDLDRSFIQVSEYVYPELNRLIGFANELASSFLGKLKSFIRVVTIAEGLSLPFIEGFNRELFEGDYKPENLLATKRDSGWRVVIIDPVISRGITQFDVAKFTARFLLGGHSGHIQELLSHFYDGYGERPNLQKLEYGPFTFADLVHMDLLNALRNYVQRFKLGDKRYHLVDSLGSEEFCLRVRHLIDGLGERE